MNNATAPVSFLDEVRSTPLERISKKEAIVLSDDHVYSVGRLSLNQILTLAKIAGKALSTSTLEDLQGIQLTRDWAATLSLLDDSTVNQLLEVILPVRTIDQTSWTEVLDISDLTQIIDAIKKHNEVGPLLALFSQAAKPPSDEPSEDSLDPTS